MKEWNGIASGVTDDSASAGSPAPEPTPAQDSVLNQRPVTGVSACASQPPSIPDYELLRRIGGGSYGEVWLARSATGVLRAVKIVWRDTFEDDRPFQREFEGIQRFERLSREHLSQLALFHVGRNDAARCFYYVMELADGVGNPNAECRKKPEIRMPKTTLPAPTLRLRVSDFGFRICLLLRISAFGIRIYTSPTPSAPTLLMATGLPRVSSNSAWRSPRRSHTCTDTVSSIATSSRRTSSSSVAGPSWRTSAW